MPSRFGERNDLRGPHLSQNLRRVHPVRDHVQVDGSNSPAYTSSVISLQEACPSIRCTTLALAPAATASDAPRCGAVREVNRSGQPDLTRRHRSNQPRGTSGCAASRPWVRGTPDHGCLVPTSSGANSSTRNAGMWHRAPPDGSSGCRPRTAHRPRQRRVPPRSDGVSGRSSHRHDPRVGAPVRKRAPAEAKCG